jgi:predicted XRE-type DNA-binding protein
MKHRQGSGNVFADIGCDYPEELQVKAELARQIHRRIKALGLTQRFCREFSLAGFSVKFCP